ncbi:hypothetical protein [Chloracidobacterium aggregatum]|uniref:hypothetical protein n=1 Tax=Chloracidobacterium aggregatum TaxID=2851959 RepID=UPI00387EA547
MPFARRVSPMPFCPTRKTAARRCFARRATRDCHIILRGGRVPNYDAHHVAEAVQLMESAGLPARIMIDCSHANSGKDHRRQPVVCHNVAHPDCGRQPGDHRHDA